MFACVSNNGSIVVNCHSNRLVLASTLLGSATGYNVGILLIWIRGDTYNRNFPPISQKSIDVFEHLLLLGIGLLVVVMSRSLLLLFLIAGLFLL